MTNKETNSREVDGRTTFSEAYEKPKGGNEK